jgi:hypothetical protein
MTKSKHYRKKVRRRKLAETTHLAVNEDRR